MSSRGRNHTRGTMHAWREMAKEDGYRVPKRWRWYVRYVAEDEGYTFAAAWLHTLYWPTLGYSRSASPMLSRLR